MHQICVPQVDLKKVVEHVCDTAGHLLKPRVTLEKSVDQTTPLIAGDGSRIVQVSAVCCLTLLFHSVAVLRTCQARSEHLLDYPSCCSVEIHTCCICGLKSMLIAVHYLAALFSRYSQAPLLHCYRSCCLVLSPALLTVLMCMSTCSTLGSMPQMATCLPPGKPQPSAQRFPVARQHGHTYN